MAKYKIVARGRPNVPGDYTFEMESLKGVDAQLEEVIAASDDEFVHRAQDADALIVRGGPVTEKVINGLQKCKIIALDSVGTNHVDISAATAKGIPVTNCPDINIQEVAEHTATLILAAHRRLLLMDKVVREGSLVGGTSTFTSVAPIVRSDPWVYLLWKCPQGRCAIDEAVWPPPPRLRSLRHGDHNDSARGGAGRLGRAITAVGYRLEPSARIRRHDQDDWGRAIQADETRCSIREHRQGHDRGRGCYGPGTERRMDSSRCAGRVG